MLRLSPQLADLLRDIQQPSLQSSLLLFLSTRALNGHAVLLDTKRVSFPRVVTNADGDLTFTDFYVPAVINGLHGAIVGRYRASDHGWTLSGHT